MPVGPYILWPEKRQEVNIQLTHPDVYVRAACAASSNTGMPCWHVQADDIFHGVDGAHGVGDPGNGNDLHARD